MDDLGLTPEDMVYVRLDALLEEANPDDCMYVYWMDGGRKIKPAILTNVTPFAELYEFLREEYGHQRYYVMIRRKRDIIFSGEIGIAVPLNFTSRKDIRAEIERLRCAERKTKQLAQRK